MQKMNRELSDASTVKVSLVGGVFFLILVGLAVALAAIYSTPLAQWREQVSHNDVGRFPEPRLSPDRDVSPTPRWR